VQIVVKAGVGGRVEIQVGGWAYLTAGQSASRTLAVGSYLEVEEWADTGYRFVGWYFEGTRVSLDSRYRYDVAVPGTLEGRFATSFTVTFDARGGSPTPPSQAVAVGGKAVRPSDPVKPGYYLENWVYDDGGYYPVETSWDFSEIVDRDLALRANWSERSYVVTINGNGGWASDPGITVPYGESLEHWWIPAPFREGYTHIGWCADAACTRPWNLLTDKVTSTMTLYARWRGEPVVAVFKGGGNARDVSVNTYFGDRLTRPGDPVRTGYDFRGWFKNSACTAPWNFSSDTAIRDLIVYSKWEAKTYTISYNSQGGSAVASVKAKYDSTIPQPKAKPTKKKRAFAGWYLDSKTSQSVSGRLVTGNMTLYAKWVPLVTTKFVANGGRFPGGFKKLAITAGKGMSIYRGPPSRAGYVFKGWYRNKGATRSIYSEAGMISAFKGTAYAGWAKLYKISFVLNGGSGGPGSQTVAAGSKPSLKSPSRAGFTFAGWYRNKALTNPWRSTDTVKGTTTLYAKWTKYVPPAQVSIAKGPSFSKMSYSSTADVGVVQTSLKFVNAGTYTIEHDMRAGSDRKMSKIFKRTVKAGQVVPIELRFLLTRTKVGSSNYQVKVTDSSGKVVLTKAASIGWHIGDIGTDMSVEN